MRRTLRSEIVRPGNFLLALVEDDREPGGWRYALEVDGITQERYDTLEEATDAYNSYLDEARTAGATF